MKKNVFAAIYMYATSLLFSDLKNKPPQKPALVHKSREIIDPKNSPEFVALEQLISVLR